MLSIITLMLALGASPSKEPLIHQPPVSDSVIAIVGATVIDGNGGTPMPDATVVVVGKRISAVGPRSTVRIPKGAHIVNATGKFLVPGFIDTNVHLSIYDSDESFARYQTQFTDIAIEGAQLELKYGVTTVHDSYGMLAPLREARDRINRGEVPGARMYIAGNIVGWGGPWSVTFTGKRPEQLTLFQEQMRDAITEGSGEDLIDMTPDQLRVAINKYLDKGVDIIKYGGTTHAFKPSLIIFSERAQRVLVEETHKRGKLIETHATSPEGLRMAVEAGVDIVQHPENGDTSIPDETVKLMGDRKVVCAFFPAMWATDSELVVYKKASQDTAKKKTEIPLNTYTDSVTAELLLKRGMRAMTSDELKVDSIKAGGILPVFRDNAARLLKAGCIATPATDTQRDIGPDFSRDVRMTTITQPGIATIQAIESLTKIGLTPSQAIVAATKNGAIASHALDKFGTIEPGKYADLVLLSADPLVDIKNIERQTMVMKEGKIIDVKSLPLKPVFYRPIPKAVP